MKVLVTGANGYIGSCLIPALMHEGHDVVALVRNKKNFQMPSSNKGTVQVIEGDFLARTLPLLPQDIEVCYYLIHSMKERHEGFTSLEEKSAHNFCKALGKTNAKQVIYLSGLSNEAPHSEHMKSRQHVEEVLEAGAFALTVFRMGIVIGEGSASFEIMRDLVEKLPVMVAPRWVESKCQPISIRDVLFYLVHAAANKKCFNKRLELAGPDVLTYRQMLLQFARIRGMKRWIFPIPLLTPHLSSLWLWLITRVNVSLAKALVASLTVDATRSNDEVHTLIPHTCLNFEQALKAVFSEAKQSLVIEGSDAREDVEVPKHGCVSMQHRSKFKRSFETVQRNLWHIGGERGWYSIHWLWALRGFVDKLFRGPGFNKGRSHPHKLQKGDKLDFWKVIRADEEKGVLILFGQMKMPGHVWMQWHLKKGEPSFLTQKVVFRPKGLLGRLYWYLTYPLHMYAFSSLIRSITHKK